MTFPPEPVFSVVRAMDTAAIADDHRRSGRDAREPNGRGPHGGQRVPPGETYPIQWTAVTGRGELPVAVGLKGHLRSRHAAGRRARVRHRGPCPAHAVPNSRCSSGCSAVNTSGVVGLPSPTVAIQLTYKAPVPAAPSLLAPADGATVLLPVTLEWTADPNPQVEGYQLEINSTPSFAAAAGVWRSASPGSANPSDTLFSLPAGVQYWRVRSFHGLAGPERGAATAWSPARHFTVSDAPPTVQSLTIDVFTEGGVVLRSHTHVFSGTNEDNEAFGIVQLTTPAHREAQPSPWPAATPKAAAVPPSIRGPRRAGARELHDPAAAGRPPAHRSP